MLVDEVEITLEGGHGGPGKASFFKKGRGPDGGNGGKGGDVYFKVVSDLTALSRFSGKKLFKAAEGKAGESNQKSGKNGEDLDVVIPVGTEAIDQETQEFFFFNNVGERILICKGGIGGLGNADLKSARMTTPIHAQHGLPGQRRDLKLILKLIADFGLIGLPNAGKSSLLNELTAANVRTADYPFTTLEPNLGVFNPSTSSGQALLTSSGRAKILADVPGLIEGAAEGKGLGIRFLKHIEKVPVLLHCLAVNSSDLLADYKTIHEELKRFNPLLLKKKEIILLTKTDLVSSEELKIALEKLKKLRKKVLPVSIHDWDSLESLKVLLSQQLTQQF